jgi:hypothetical protein
VKITKRRFALIPLAAALTLLLGAGCRAASESPQPGSLTGRVWARADSTGLPGVMLIFLGDGTLVMDSCWETYRLARWQRESDSTLRWQEDAADIRATIRTLTDSVLVLALHLRDGSETQRYIAAPVPYLCPDMKKGLAGGTACSSSCNGSSARCLEHRDRGRQT